MEIIIALAVVAVATVVIGILTASIGAVIDVFEDKKAQHDFNQSVNQALTLANH